MISSEDIGLILKYVLLGMLVCSGVLAWLDLCWAAKRNEEIDESERAVGLGGRGTGHARRD